MVIVVCRWREKEWWLLLRVKSSCKYWTGRSKETVCLVRSREAEVARLEDVTVEALVMAGKAPEKKVVL